MYAMNCTQNHVPAVDTAATGRLPYAVQTDGAREHTEHHDEQGKARAAGLYAATVAYEAALTQPDPAANLDGMCDGLAGIMSAVCKALAVTAADVEFAEILRDSIAARLWAFTAIERSRTQCGDGYSYIFDFLADGVKNGGDPRIARQTALDVPKRIRENAEAAR